MFFGSSLADADGITMTISNWAYMFDVMTVTVRKWMSVHSLPIPPNSPRNAKRLAAWEYAKAHQDKVFESAPEGGVRVKKMGVGMLSTSANTSSVAGKKIKFGCAATYVSVFPDTNIPKPVITRIQIRR